VVLGRVVSFGRSYIGRTRGRSMKTRHWCVPFVVVVCLMSAGLAAQQGTGELRGRAMDAQSAAMPGVSILAKNQATGQFREAVSGPDGSFFMSALTPGLYEVTA